MSKLDKGATATNSFGFNAGTDALLSFYADELIYKLVLNEHWSNTAEHR